MDRLEKFETFKIENIDLLKLIGGQESCQHYENLCMQTAYNNGNTFLMDDCDAMCDAQGNWN